MEVKDTNLQLSSDVPTSDSWSLEVMDQIPFIKMGEDDSKNRYYINDRFASVLRDYRLDAYINLCRRDIKCNVSSLVDFYNRYWSDDSL